MNALTMLAVLLIATVYSPVQAGMWERLFGPDNYWECLLETMPGTLTYGGAMEKRMQCGKQFPDKNSYRLGLGVLGPKSLTRCQQKYLTADTKDPLARQSIRQACYRLFPPD